MLQHLPYHDFHARMHLTYRHQPTYIHTASTVHLTKLKGAEYVQLMQCNEADTSLVFLPLSFNIFIHRIAKKASENEKKEVKTPFFYILFVLFSSSCVRFWCSYCYCCLFLNNGEIIDDGPEKFSNISLQFPAKGYIIFMV